MKANSKKSMYIYISGPYSAPNKHGDNKQNIIEQNIERAKEVALKIANKGHYPFVPHTMMRGWEEIQKVDRFFVMRICKKWIERCDALFFIGTSEGAEEERKVAVELDLPIYYDLDEIPEAATTSSPKLSEEAIKAYFVEYEQCMESYRHTYTTIWQAGSIFAAVAAGIIAFANSSNGGTIPWWIQMLAPVPVLFWWWGIYLPMNRYGERRLYRLIDIEKLLSHGGAAIDLHMRHFQLFDRERRGRLVEKMSATKKNRTKDRVILCWEYIKERILSLKFLWRPRVVEVVTIFGFGLLFLEMALLIKNLSKIVAWITHF